VPGLPGFCVSMIVTPHLRSVGAEIGGAAGLFAARRNFYDWVAFIASRWHAR
jgi:hypothetical protein